MFRTSLFQRQTMVDDFVRARSVSMYAWAICAGALVW
jgi:hypothetical protein